MHVYTIHMDEEGIWMEYTRHIPGIYQKAGFQMAASDDTTFAYLPVCGGRMSESHTVRPIGSNFSCQNSII